VVQNQWHSGSGWQPAPSDRERLRPAIVFVFGSREAISDPERLSELRATYPDALLFGCSTAGEIIGTRVEDETLCVTAVQFERTKLQSRQCLVEQPSDSFAAGVALAAALPKDELKHILVLSDGLNVNGSELVRGLTRALPAGVTLTGGLSADGARFQSTLVLGREGPRERIVAAVGLYSKTLSVGCASLGGWDPFGPEREVTRSKGNVLYELDGRSALALYKEYLGPHADALPSSGLLFPLSLRTTGGSPGLVRTILSVDEGAQSLTFAGDVPQGAYARLMKANVERLIDGAVGAAESCVHRGTPVDLALLISCVGRKLVLRQRVEEEVEAVRGVLGPGTAMMGFYSYGEISPFTPDARCELHNQTMTITTFSER